MPASGTHCVLSQGLSRTLEVPSVELAVPVLKAK